MSRLDPVVTDVNTRPTTDLTGILKWKDGSQYFFDNTGAVYRIQDRVGNFLAIYRNSKGYPVDIRQPSGRTVHLTYTTGTSVLLSSVTLPLGRTWQFSYDNSSPPRLTRVTDPTGAHMDYTWTSFVRSDGLTLPLVQTCSDRLGNTKVVNSYDGQGRVVAQTFADGGVLSVAYSGAVGQNGSTVVTDPNQNATEYDYQWNPAQFGYDTNQVVDKALNRTWTCTRAPGSNLVTAITDFLGRTFTLGWDLAKGNLLSLTAPSTDTSGNLTTSTWGFLYDSTFSQLTLATDPLGHQTELTVDSTSGNTTSVRDPLGFVTSMVYAKNGDLMSITDQTEATSRFRYTPEGDPEVVVDPLNHETIAFYDAASRPIGVRDANSKQVRVDYTPLDDVAHITRYLNGAPVVTQYQHDAEQNLRFLVDPMGRTWEWRYDAENRVIQALDPLGLSSFATWDLNDNLVQWRDRKGQIGQYTLGAGDLLMSAAFTARDGVSPESSYTVGYDTHHLVNGVTEYSGGSLAQTFAYAYDAASRLKEEDWTPAGGTTQVVSQILDQLGRRYSLSVTGQTPVTYGYSPRNEITSIMQDSASTTFQYDRAGRLIARAFPAANGVSTAWAYNAVGGLTGITSKHNGDIIDQHAYTPDPVGNITQEITNGLTWNYQRDDFYRLTQATVGSNTYAWTYNLAGDRLSQTINGAKTLYGYDGGGHMVSVGGVPVSYDANGNATNSGSDTYTWDVRNRLLGLSRPSLGVTGAFSYDYQGRRRSKTVNTINNGTPISFVLDGDEIVSELTGGSTIATLQSPLVDQPIKRNGLYLTPNQLGSTTTLTDSNGNLVEQYFYLPFGETWQSAGTSSPFQFAGRENDGTGLYYNRARYYNPAWGRFVSADPAGFGGGINPYVYAGNNPVNDTDASGLTIGPPPIFPVYDEGADAGGGGGGGGVPLMGDDWGAFWGGVFHGGLGGFGAGAPIRFGRTGVPTDKLVIDPLPPAAPGGGSIPPAPTAAPPPEDVVGPDVSLGLRWHLRPFSDATGGLRYNQWPGIGTEPFPDTFTRMMNQAGTIHFNLEGMDMARAHSYTGTGYPFDWTNWEFQQIWNNPIWYNRTRFYNLPAVP
jgi:RHS repeat-associated protein